MECQYFKDGAVDYPASDVPCDCCDSLDFVIYRYEATPDWNASWCSDQDGTACGRYHVSRVPNETRKCIVYKMTFDTEDNTTSNVPCKSP